VGKLSYWHSWPKWSIKVIVAKMAKTSTVGNLFKMAKKNSQMSTEKLTYSHAKLLFYGRLTFFLSLFVRGCQWCKFWLFLAKVNNGESFGFSWLFWAKVTNSKSFDFYWSFSANVSYGESLFF